MPEFHPQTLAACWSRFAGTEKTPREFQQDDCRGTLRKPELCIGWALQSCRGPQKKRWGGPEYIEEEWQRHCSGVCCRGPITCFVFCSWLLHHCMSVAALGSPSGYPSRTACIRDVCQGCTWATPCLCVHSWAILRSCPCTLRLKVYPLQCQGIYYTGHRNGYSLSFMLGARLCVPHVCTRRSGEQTLLGGLGMQ